MRMRWRSWRGSTLFQHGNKLYYHVLFPFPFAPSMHSAHWEIIDFKTTQLNEIMCWIRICQFFLMYFLHIPSLSHSYQATYGCAVLCYAVCDVNWIVLLINMTIFSHCLIFVVSTTKEFVFTRNLIKS